MDTILTMPPSRNIILGQLAALWNLNPGWDGRGGKRPSIKCLTSVGLVLNFLPHEGHMPNSLEPIPTGGIRAKWRAKPLTIVWDQNGNITATLGNHTEKVRDASQCRSMISVALGDTGARRASARSAAPIVYHQPIREKRNGGSGGLRERVARRQGIGRLTLGGS